MEKKFYEWHLEVDQSHLSVLVKLNHYTTFIHCSVKDNETC